jgi:hypothetical protein
MYHQITRINEIKQLINEVKEQNKEYKKIKNKKIGNIIFITLTIITISAFAISIYAPINETNNFCGGHTEALGNTM